jgi:hypothetical protein
VRAGGFIYTFTTPSFTSYLVTDIRGVPHHHSQNPGLEVQIHHTASRDQITCYERNMLQKTGWHPVA